jgi:hypothetical protein
LQAAVAVVKERKVKLTVLAAVLAVLFITPLLPLQLELHTQLL